MEQKNSRGGVKPRMLAQSEDWALDTGQGYAKKGIYEFNARTGELFDNCCDSQRYPNHRKIPLMFV